MDCPDSPAIPENEIPVALHHGDSLNTKSATCPCNAIGFRQIYCDPPSTEIACSTRVWHKKLQQYSGHPNQEISSHIGSGHSIAPSRKLSPISAPGGNNVDRSSPAGSRGWPSKGD